MRISWAIQTVAVFCLVAAHPALADSTPAKNDLTFVPPQGIHNTIVTRADKDSSEHERPRARPGPSRTNTLDGYHMDPKHRQPDVGKPTKPRHDLKPTKEPRHGKKPRHGKEPRHGKVPKPKPTDKPNKPNKPHKPKHSKPNKPKHNKPKPKPKPKHNKPKPKPKPKPTHKPKPKPQKPDPKPQKPDLGHEPNTGSVAPTPASTTVVNPVPSATTTSSLIPSVVPDTNSRQGDIPSGLPSSQPTSGNAGPSDTMSGNSGSPFPTIIGVTVGSVALAGLVALGIYRQREKRRAAEDLGPLNPEMDEAPRTAFRHESFMVLVKDAAQGFYAPGTEPGAVGTSSAVAVAATSAGIGGASDLSRQGSARSQNSQRSVHSRRSGNYSRSANNSLNGAMPPSSATPPPLAHLGR